MNRSGVDLSTFVQEYAENHGLSAADRQRVHDRHLAATSWLKILERLVMKRRAGQHLTEAPLIEATRAYHFEHGELAFRLGPGDTFSPQGYGFPRAQLEEESQYVFYGLFRDGIIGIALLPGVSDTELRTLLDVLVAEGRREGDDALTWLWAQGHDSMRLAVRPDVTPRTAAAMVQNRVADPRWSTYLRALAQATDAASPPADKAVRGEPVALSAYGIAPDLAAKLAPDAPAPDWCAPPDDGVRVQYRTFMTDPEELAERRKRIRSRGTGGISV